MQLKYSFKKEKMQFFRTFRFLVIVIVMVSFAFSNPLLFKFTSVMLDVMYDTVEVEEGSADTSHSADVFSGITLDVDAPNIKPPMAQANPENPTAALQSALDEIGMDSVLDMYTDAGLMFATSITTLAGGALLIAMLLLMSAAGGEQKKRAMIVPMCSGLSYKSYLIPKFTIYPITIFCVTFVSSVIAGGLCNMLFENNHISIGILLLSSLLISVYNVFIICIFLAMGLMTSKPGVSAPLIYVGQLIIQSLLAGFGLSKYQPFALLDYAGGAMTREDFSFAEHTASIIVSVAIALAVSVLMYFLALAVLNAKKIDNQAEKEPEF